MENSLAVAKALFCMYEKKYHCSIDELKMHKLMYFIQRESLIVNDDILFDESFVGWKYGPVLLSVRNEYLTGMMFRDIFETVAESTIRLINDVLNRFGRISAWSLSVMSHDEISWKLSRDGLKSSDNGNTELLVSAMRIDAAREIARRQAQ